ncbi:MAG: hypothetical protein U1A78_28155 [Polyangia bacterium]
MKTGYLAIFLAAAALSGCAVPNKVLVSHNFNAAEKTSKILIMDSGQVDPSTKRKLFNVLVRLCDLDTQGNEASCKDTRVAENVMPGSVY